jgi:hypothetical protein
MKHDDMNLAKAVCLWSVIGACAWAVLLWWLCQFCN